MLTAIEFGDLKQLSYFAVRPSLDAQEQNGALSLGQQEKRPPELPTQQRVARQGWGREQVGVGGSGPDFSSPDEIARSIANNLQEPRMEPVRLRASPETVECSQERVLDNVLRVRPAPENTIRDADGRLTEAHYGSLPFENVRVDNFGLTGNLGQTYVEPL